MKEIENKQDVAHLVHSFYDKVRTDAVLGPIFKGIIHDWDAHLDLLTNFWETQLFLKRTYEGNPIPAHQKMDDEMNGNITPEHFGLWINLWFETLDQLFTGEKAWIAKNRAQKMSTMFYIKIFEHRQSKST
ncbi:group III truncated hemoglobin [Flagellimonas beolgyonensis]|uniref:group III truncated hemoglobin n=1 Tax=Flagellimonas beolgyonensis TaxID=864064 RepID=UPI003D649E2C